MTKESIITRLERDYKDGIGAMLTSNDIKELLEEVNDEQRKYNANLQNRWNRQEVWDEGNEKGYMDAWDKATKQFQEEIANAKMTIERDEALRTEYHREIEEKDRKIAGLMADFAAHEQEIRELKTDSCYITNAELKTKIKELEARIRT
ncbi:MAG: hypothetical protein IMZ64_13005 [Bacteroidetes bacterium]|nr:hypothetical protein [Bacteroidota bacterium]